APFRYKLRCGYGPRHSARPGHRGGGGWSGEVGCGHLGSSPGGRCAERERASRATLNEEQAGVGWEEMSQHEAFLRSIIEAPEDDAPRLVYADWLEDQGDLERAEFIRVQCRLAEMDEDDPLRSGLLRREYELLVERWGEWAGPLVGRAQRWR